jgi:hypothetical protein
MRRCKTAANKASLQSGQNLCAADGPSPSGTWRNGWLAHLSTKTPSENPVPVGRPTPNSLRPPHGALSQWIDLFVDLLVTKHGLAAVMRSDHAGFQAQHTHILDRLVPVCAQQLKAAARTDEIRADVDVLELMRGVGNLCVSIGGDSRYDARRMVGLLNAGLRKPQSS